MATSEQRARRAAQRATAKRVRSGRYERQFPRETAQARNTRERYIEHLLTHPDEITPRDEKELARRASYAQWEQRNPGSHPKADPRWEQWKDFFYHGGAT